MPNYGYNFNSGDSVTPERLNAARTITDIVNADIATNAEIAVSKLADGAARQLLQTDAAGTGVEWTDNVDVPGTLDVTGAATLDSTLAVTGAATFAPGVVVTGTSSDSAVRITQLGTGNALVVEDSANPDSTPVVIDASGNTVIGHTAAVSIGGTAQPLTVNGLGASIVRAAADAFGAVLNFCKSRSTTVGAARAIAQSGDELGTINFAADNGDNLNVIAASVAAELDGTPGSADMPGRLIFSTTPDGDDEPIERMRITNAGNVGIGKTPATKLDVDGTVTAPTFVGDLTGTASIIADDTVTDAKVAAGAAIAHSKLANITAGQVLLGNASNVPTATAVTGDVTISNTGVTAISSGVIVDADIKSDAAIALSKLATGALPSAITVASANIVDGTIVNADISASAAIAHSKLANLTAGQVLLGNATNVPTATALSGDVTINSSGVTAIGAGVIVNADINASAAIDLSKLDTGALPTGITVASANLVDGTIVNADISASAAIALSKLATGALPTTITVASANLVDGTIVNADINNSAAIAGTKIAPAFGAQDITVGSGDRSISTTTNHALAFGTNNAERMRINSDGRVIIGHNAPVSLTGSLGFEGLQVHGLGAAPSTTFSRWTNDTGGINMAFVKSRSGTVGTLGGAVASGNTIGNITWLGDDGTNSVSAAQITAQVDGTPGTNDMPGRLVFSTTADGASTVTERMRIDSAGNVGIGTSNPNSKTILDLSSTTKGFLPPRMTTAQRDAISTPPAGLLIYNTTTNKLNVYTTAWEAVTSS